MLASHKWLKELSGLDLSPHEMASKLTSAGVEVEALQARGEKLDNVVIAEVRAQRPHSRRRDLRLVTLFDGVAEQEVVCGAPNVPTPGGRVVFARVGAVLPDGTEVCERNIGGVASAGMICSEVELDIGSDEQGVLVLEEATTAESGCAVADALDLEDTVLEIGVTPNRPDCLGHVGLARELCTLCDEPFEPVMPACPQRIVRPCSSLLPQRERAFSLLEFCARGSPEVVSGEESGFGQVRVDILDPERCPRYGAVLVAKVKVAPSPFWVRYRLHLLGLRAINNAVDATNLVLMGFGHPIHAFDCQLLKGSRILVRRAASGEQVTTLDGQSRSLTDDDLLICDDEAPVALAGVMGAANSEINARTELILIECAYFDPRSVRRTARRTGLHTESSHRFERGVDPGGVRDVLAGAASLMARLTGGAVVAEALDVQPAPVQPRRIALRHGRLEALLGCAVNSGDVRRILAGVGCQVSAGDTVLDVLAPTYRPDLLREVDLIEEVARVRGYDAIPTEMPKVRPSLEDAPRITGFVQRLRELAASAGLTEAVNYAFVSVADLALARVCVDAVGLANPLSEERAVLRTSLLPGLLANLVRAQHHQVKRFQQFELARTFESAGPGRLPRESHSLAILLCGPREQWFGDGDHYDFYDCKGRVGSVLHPLCGEFPTTQLDSRLQDSAGHYHPRRCARLHLAGHAIGHLGELHPDVVEAWKVQGRPVFASVDVELALEAVEGIGFRQGKALPRFPAIVRDLAVVVREELPAGDIAFALREAAGDLAEEVALFDIYRGNPVPEGYKSMAFRVVYREPGGTLTDATVDEVHARVVRSAESRFRATVRAHS